jgi:predicted transcriptional regulator
MVMPCKENTTMDLRVDLIRDYETGYSVTELADIYHVSRRTIYKCPDRPPVVLAGLASDDPQT